MLKSIDNFLDKTPIGDLLIGSLFLFLFIAMPMAILAVEIVVA